MKMCVLHFKFQRELSCKLLFVSWKHYFRRPSQFSEATSPNFNTACTTTVSQMRTERTSLSKVTWMMTSAKDYYLYIIGRACQYLWWQSLCIKMPSNCEHLCNTYFYLFIILKTLQRTIGNGCLGSYNCGLYFLNVVYIIPSFTRMSWIYFTCVPS